MKRGSRVAGLLTLLALAAVAALADAVVLLRPRRETAPLPPSRLEGIILKEPVEGGLTPLAAAGRRVFARECAICHGPAGAGDGFNSFNLAPLGAKPRDLGDPAYQSSAGDLEVEGAIRSGGAAVGRSRFMPPYGKTLSDTDVRSLVAYLRTLHRQ